jgi:hypothetical protein
MDLSTTYSGGPHHPWIFKKTYPFFQLIRGSTTIVALQQHTKCSRALQAVLKIISIVVNLFVYNKRKQQDNRKG